MPLVPWLSLGRWPARGRVVESQIYAALFSSGSAKQRAIRQGLVPSHLGTQLRRRLYWTKDQPLRNSTSATLD